MKPRLCVVVASDLSVRTFLRPHLMALHAHYALTVVANTNDEQLLERIGVNGTLKRVPISRAISLVRDLQALASLVWLFRRERFDVVHSLTPKAGLLAMTAAWLTGVPVRLHTFTGQVWANRAGWSRAFLKVMDAMIARCATFTLTDSVSQRRLLVAEHVVRDDRIDVLGQGSVSGVNSARFRPDPVRRQHVRDRMQIGDTDLVLLFVGRLTHDKGVLDLARAFAILAAERPDAQLILVGPDEQLLRPAIVALCRDCGPRVHFVEFTDTPEEIVAAADLLCLPSYREGFPNVILEAAAAGIPTVASHICGLVDAVEEGRTGLLHEPRDVGDLLARLRMLAADPVLRHKLGAAARARVERDFQPEALTTAETRALEGAILVGVDLERHRLAALDPGGHLLRDLGNHLERIEPYHRHHRHLGLDELAKIHEPPLDETVEGGADFSVPELASRQLHARLGALDAGAQVAGVLKGGVILRLLRLQRRLGGIERFLRDQRSLEQLRGTVVRLLRLEQVGLGPLSVRRLLDVGQMLRIGGAELGERPGQGGLLLLEGVLRLLAIELNQHLAGPHAVPKVRQNLADLTVSLGRNRDLIDGRERADHINRALDRIAADFLDLNRLRRRLLGACLCRFGARAGRATRGEGKEDKETNEKRHRVWARAARAREPGTRARTERVYAERRSRTAQETTARPPLPPVAPTRSSLRPAP